MTISAHSPCRVDLAGGTTDIWPLYLFLQSPVVVNFAVDRYTTCRIVTRPDARIVLRSLDLNAEEQFASLDDLRAAPTYCLGLLAYLLRFFTPATGLEMTTNSEAPAGAGISGSSSLMITVSSALNVLTGTGYDIEKIREVAQNIEAQIIRVPTGSQDYYPAMYGGVSAIEMGPAGIVRRPIPVDLAELERRMVLAYTGVPRNSGINNWEVMKAHINGDPQVHRNFDEIAAIAQSLRRALERSDWTESARLIRAEWTHRRTNAPGITTDLIDRLAEVTRTEGALACKVCGAGGGGCVFFLVEPDAKDRVASRIAAEGATVLPVKVAPEGVTVGVE